MAVVCLNTVAALAQVQILVQPRQALVGEPIQWIVRVEAEKRGMVPPNYPPVPGLQSAGSSQNYTSINGKTSWEWSQQYVAVRPGTYTFPPLRYEHGGKRYQSQATVVEVVAGSAVPTDLAPPASTSGKGDYRLEWVVEPREAFVNQAIRAEIRLILAEDPAEEVQLSNEHILQVRQQFQFQGVWLEKPHRTSIPSRVQRSQGRTWVSYTLDEGTFYPLQAGELQLPDIRLKISVGGAQNWLGRLLGTQQMPAETKTLMVKGPRLNIKTLPENAKGLPVGELSLDLQPDRSSMRTGGSLRLGARLSGRGYLQALPPPTVLSDSLWIVSEPEVELTPPSADQPGSKTFFYTLKPKREGNLALPRFSYRYFDPRLGQARQMEVTGPTIEVARSQQAQNAVNDWLDAQLAKTLPASTSGPLPSTVPRWLAWLWPLPGILALAWVLFRRRSRKGSDTSYNDLT